MRVLAGVGASELSTGVSLFDSLASASSRSHSLSCKTLLMFPTGEWSGAKGESPFM